MGASKPGDGSSTGGTAVRGGTGREWLDLALAWTPRRLLRNLVAVAGALVLASVLGRVVLFEAPWFPLRITIARLTYVDLEQSIPSLYSFLLLLLCGAVLVVIGSLPAAGPGGDRWHWRALGGLVALAAVDEALSLHEQLIEPTSGLLGDRANGFLYFSWVLPAAAAMCVLLLAFARFLARLPGRTRNHVVLAGVLYLGGALGAESLSGKVAHDRGFDDLTDVERTAFEDYTYVAVNAAEEGLELLGASVLLYALVDHITVQLGGLRLRVTTPDLRARRAVPARR